MKKIPHGGRAVVTQLWLPAWHSRLVFAFLAALAFAGCQSPHSARVWSSGAQGRACVAPLDFPELRELPELRRKENWGLAFSGGGTVAGITAVAQLRALKEAGLLDRVRYVSTISGGTWGVLPYIFLDPKLVPPAVGEVSQAELDRRYLGLMRAPASLTVADLKAAESCLAVKAVTGANAHLTLFRGDENFANLMARWFLRPVGLDDQSRSFAWSPEYFDRHIAPANPGFQKEDFHFAARGRPFLIAGAVLERSHRISLSDKLIRVAAPHLTPNTLAAAFWPADLTPLYAGVGPFDPSSRAPGVNRYTFFPEPEIGGGFIEPLGFDTHYAGRADGADGPRAQVRRIFDWVNFRREPAFSLADVCAASGSAPAAAAGALVDFIGLRPEFETWPVEAKSPSRESQEHAYVDGGSCDNTGLAALLARRVDKAIVFLNAISGGYHPRSGADASKHLPTMFTALFGWDGADGFRNEKVLKQSDANCFFQDLDQIILRQIDDDFARCAKAGRAIISVQHLKTNPTKAARTRYGIPTGHAVTIGFVFSAPFSLKAASDPASPQHVAYENDVWLNALPPGSEVKALFTDAKLRTAAGLDLFPAFPVFFAQQSKVQRLGAEQANALAHFTSYRLSRSLPEIRHKMGL